MTEPFTAAAPTPPARRSRRGGLVALAALVVLAVVAVLGGRALLSRLTAGTPDYDGAGTGEVVAQVQRGDSAADIGETLERLDVVKSARAFRRVASDDERSRSIQPGYYRLRQLMSARAALDLLLDPSSRVRSRYTVPEGSTLARTLDIISRSVERMPLADLKAAVANPAALGLPDYAKGQVEGYLFPATYDVEPGTSATEVLTAMVDRFKVAAEQHDLAGRAQALGRSPHDLVVMASLVEGEAGTATDRGKVAQVAYNRLAKGMRLEFDSTLKYAYSLRGENKTRLLLRDLELDSPFNSYRRTGLPPGAINSPGDAALAAAVAPTPGSWLYFVLIDTRGNSAFATTYEEFLRLKAQYKRDVLGQG